jgi:ribonuclease HI
MKTLKFEHNGAQQILEGSKNSTWRLYDDKDLSIDDHLKIIDKVQSDNPDSWKVIGQGVVTEIVEKKLDAVSPEEMKEFASKGAILDKYRKYYGHRVTLETPVKIVYFDFTPSTGDIPTAGMLLEEAKMYTDGGSRGNPGDSACAYVICNLDESVVEKSGYYMGMATNNQAEGLERARDLGINKVTLFSDSQLVVNQMKGFYKVKNQELAPLHQQLAALANSFEKIDFIHVPRELNKIADKEVNRILDEQQHNR